MHDIFDLEDEDFWLHVEFWALRGVGEHVDDQLAIHTLMMMIIIIIIIIIKIIIIVISNIIIIIIFGRQRTC